MPLYRFASLDKQSKKLIDTSPFVFDLDECLKRCTRANIRVPERKHKHIPLITEDYLSIEIYNKKELPSSKHVLARLKIIKETKEMLHELQGK